MTFLSSKMSGILTSLDAENVGGTFGVGMTVNWLECPICKVGDCMVACLIGRGRVDLTCCCTCGFVGELRSSSSSDKSKLNARWSIFLGVMLEGEFLIMIVLR